MPAAEIGDRTRPPAHPARTAELAGQRTTTPRLVGMLTGTRLLTSNGYRQVETLRRGDLVATLIGRGPMFVPIAWIGRRRHYATNEGNLDGVPVRIRRHAIGDEMPTRDILLAPDHAIYLDGALFLVRHLVNEGSICLEPRQGVVEYWGVRLERHDILAAENMAIESLMPDSTAIFVEVTAPRLTVVGSPSRGNIKEPDAAPLDFPARILMSARWIRRRLLTRARTVVAPTAEMLAPGPPPRADRRLDVATEARAVMGSFAELATQRGVRMELAVEPGLMVRMEQYQFHELLGAVLTHAVHAGSGRVLLGAMRHAGRVQIAIMDESRGTNREQQEADLRPAARLAALQGATLDVDARPDGTTILLRLLAPGKGS